MRMISSWSSDGRENQKFSADVGCLKGVLLGKGGGFFGVVIVYAGEQ